MKLITQCILQAANAANFKDVILTIHRLCKQAHLNPEGETYLEALEYAAEDYGEKGIQHQVNYILANGRFKPKDRKSLERYAKKGTF